MTFLLYKHFDHTAVSFKKLLY